MILFLATMTGCVTNRRIELPPEPERKEIETPRNYKQAALVINYYEHLVQEWEAWAETVEKLTKDKK